MGLPVSRLCLADKLAFAMTPAWLYIPMAQWTGELAEYMARSRDRQAGDKGFTNEEQILLKSSDQKQWLKGLQSYTLRWVEQNRALSTVNRVESNPKCVPVGCVTEAEER
jgi:hypothetical protein